MCFWNLVWRKKKSQLFKDIPSSVCLESKSSVCFQCYGNLCSRLRMFYVNVLSLAGCRWNAGRLMWGLCFLMVHKNFIMSSYNWELICILFTQIYEAKQRIYHKWRYFNLLMYDISIEPMQNQPKDEVAFVFYSSWRGGWSMLLFKEIIIDTEQGVPKKLKIKFFEVWQLWALSGNFGHF